MIEFYSYLIFILIALSITTTLIVSFITYRVFKSLGATLAMICVLSLISFFTIDLVEKVKSVPLVQFKNGMLILDGISTPDYIFYWVVDKDRGYPQTLALKNTKEHREQLQKIQSRQGGEGDERVLFRMEFSDGSAKRFMVKEVHDIIEQRGDKR